LADAEVGGKSLSSTNLKTLHYFFLKLLVAQGILQVILRIAIVEKDQCSFSSIGDIILFGIVLHKQFTDSVEFKVVQPCQFHTA